MGTLLVKFPLGIGEQIFWADEGSPDDLAARPLLLSAGDHRNPPFLGGGLRYNEATSPGPQTERRGDAAPVRGLLAVRTSPAVLLLCLTLS
jgi:hypothetical protein